MNACLMQDNAGMNGQLDHHTHSVSESAGTCIDILGHLCIQAVAESMMARDGKSTQLRLLVPTPLCGAIIGKGGATIRSFAEDSRAAITVSPQDKQPLGIPDRVVRITGAQDQLLRAVALLLTKLVESPNYTRFTTSNVSYGPLPQVSSPAPELLRTHLSGPCCEPVADEISIRVTAIARSAVIAFMDAMSGHSNIHKH